MKFPLGEFSTTAAFQLAPFGVFREDEGATVMGHLIAALWAMNEEAKGFEVEVGHWDGG